MVLLMCKMLLCFAPCLLFIVVGPGSLADGDMRTVVLITFTMSCFLCLLILMRGGIVLLSKTSQNKSCVRMAAGVLLAVHAATWLLLALLWISLKVEGLAVVLLMPVVFLVIGLVRRGRDY